ncbi:hypothetical protein K491DRAFT_713432 [Lophiostoma macrostomum CBS 122681]|uniref:F-box domain-containing protein n=1 Tax=Lophiostoma macrostomum CBS 122681 TaxID=1314788 RepID=A0A6A6THS5_9PLEO|nr:hypothetical protein K491DRAFT_713432 [Lophiostoma macrostomum CBS 122681]
MDDSKEEQLLPGGSPASNHDSMLSSLLSRTSLSTLETSLPPTLDALPFEILEAILLHLPAQDLLLSQRICRTFREMVIASKRIRRTLFLEPAHHPGKLEDWKMIRWNPFLESQLSEILNIRVIGVHRGGEGTVKMVAHVRYRKVAIDLDAFLHGEASWKHMLVTQPPATSLMHPSASLFWKSSLEDQAQFFNDRDGFTILDLVSCEHW